MLLNSEAPLPPAARSAVGEFVWGSESVQVLVLSAAGDVLQWNGAAARGLGRYVEIREGEPVWGLLAANSAALLRASMASAPSRSGRTLLTFTDGERFAFTLSCTLYCVDGTCYLLGEQLVEREQRMNAELMALTSDLAGVSRERAKIAAELERTLTELRTSHWQIRKIQEHLPICSVCHLVPSGGGRWEPLIKFLARNRLLMTHGYCPECEAAAFAELDRVLPP